VSIIRPVLAECFNISAELERKGSSMAELRNGALVFHAHLGAGTVISTRKMDISGTNQRYYVVELASGNKLLLPVNQIGQICSLRTSKAIGEVLSAAPEDLAANYHQRRGDIEKKIKSGDQLQYAEVFRDLAWRGHNTRLSNTDKEFMNSMKKRLIDILSIQTDLGIQEAAQWLELTLQKIILSWSTGEQHESSPGRNAEVGQPESRDNSK
jgi:CarD family transcriptional regulator